MLDLRKSFYTRSNFYNFRKKCVLSFPPATSGCKIILKRNELTTIKIEASLFKILEQMDYCMIFFYKVISVQIIRNVSLLLVL